MWYREKRGPLPVMDPVMSEFAKQKARIKARAFRRPRPESPDESGDAVAIEEIDESKEGTVASVAK